MAVTNKHRKKHMAGLGQNHIAICLKLPLGRILLSGHLRHSETDEHTSPQHHAINLVRYWCRGHTGACIWQGQMPSRQTRLNRVAYYCCVAGGPNARNSDIIHSVWIDFLWLLWWGSGARCGRGVVQVGIFIRIGFVDVCAKQPLLWIYVLVRARALISVIVCFKPVGWEVFDFLVYVFFENVGLPNGKSQTERAVRTSLDKREFWRTHMGVEHSINTERKSWRSFVRRLGNEIHHPRVQNR